MCSLSMTLAYGGAVAGLVALVMVLLRDAVKYRLVRRLLD